MDAIFAVYEKYYDEADFIENLNIFSK